MKLINPTSVTLGLCGLLAAGPVLSGCNAHDLQAPNPKPEMQVRITQDVNPVRDLDIVFMIDDSNSMEQEQMNLANNFPVFMQALKNIPGGLPDVHIGVVSSDVGAGNIAISGNPACNRPGGDRGIFQAKAGCGQDAGANFLISLNNGTMNNFTGKIEDVFSCIAALGTQGCGYEHQLQSVRVALAENVTPQNANFLRPNAYLAIILITDEDDCSAAPDSDLFVDPMFAMGMEASLRCNFAGHICNGKKLAIAPFSTPLYDITQNPPVANCEDDPNGRLIPVKEFVDFMYGLKPLSPEKIIVSAITGWPAKLDTPYAISQNSTHNLLDIEPACASTNGTAAPALRVHKFIESFGQNGTVESICQGDFTPALMRIADLIASKIKPGCIPGKLLDKDLDPTNGFQPECSVVERIPNQVTGKTDDKIVGGACDNTANPAMSTNKPCYSLVQDATCAGGSWRIDVLRNGMADPGTLQVATCRTCAVDAAGMVRGDPALCM